MSNRELVIDLVSKLPEDASMEDILEEIRFVAGVKEAIAESDRGEVVSIEEARRQIRLWTSKSS
jgi:predicted transcriptional regulator